MISKEVEAGHAFATLKVLSEIKEILEYVYDGIDHAPLPSTILDGSVALQGCLPLLLHGTPPEILKQQVNEKKYQQLRQLYQQSSLLNLWYTLELKSILKAFEDAQIATMVLKGADLAETVYPHPELRHFGDVDLMVRSGNLDATLAVLENQGYHYQQEYRFEAVSKQRAGYVYAKQVSSGYLLFEIHTSPHANEMGVSFESEQLWERARPITIAGVNVYGMGIEDLLLYLCWHYRSHTFSRLIWLCDITMVLLRYADQLDWALVQQLAHKHGLRATLYFSMHLCQQVFHFPLSEYAQIEKCKPPGYVYWLMKRFLRESVLHRTARSKRKVLQYLLVDNFSALCRIGLRLFFPSTTHLGRLYMEHSALPLSFFWLYYFVHPLYVLKALYEVIF